ncbi:hypothetical protein M9H77_26164 [Catharanthus roseus]|uniref:Uncharacterized protein n=1 Tax=Catharanthus roseus TaxID=4058 RepID=A0ACC0A9C7_CATRO|nr:hypothetical protein M9H77_26164 [Catharanthus roseus]
MSDQDPANCCFRNWMNLQEEDLSELLQALNLDADHDKSGTNDDQLNQLTLKAIEHFEDYIKKRAHLGRESATTFFAPRWCTMLECSMMWIAGCRPSIYIRLLYALIGEEFENRIEEYIQGIQTGTLGDISTVQMNLINNLHIKTIREEDKMSMKLASLQEDMADDPISIIAKKSRTCHNEPPSAEIRKALDEHEKSMWNVMRDADELRLNTLKELLSILTPVQGVNFLAASKKLHLCLHGWTRERELQQHASMRPPPSDN